jgi:hypothetical protein|tara:strand:- start:357 stop:557 length:201 start_codon:yes stop_codon:yes gene_type:complete
MTNLIEYANQVAEKYPNLKGDIDGLMDLCIMEIEEGSPEPHEIQLCWTDIEQLVDTEELKVLSRHI